MNVKLFRFPNPIMVKKRDETGLSTLGKVGLGRNSRDSRRKETESGSSGVMSRIGQKRHYRNGRIRGIESLTVATRRDFPVGVGNSCMLKS